MSDIYSDSFEAAGEFSARLIPETVTRVAGAAVFVGLVLTMGVWSYRLGTRDAAEVPIIRAMEGPARIQPEDPGGAEAAHQGLAVNQVLAGLPEVREAVMAASPPVALAAEDGPQGQLVLPAPDFGAAAIGDMELPAPDEEGFGGEGAPGADPISAGDEVSRLIAEAMASAEAEGAAPDAQPTRPRSRPSGFARPDRALAASAAAAPAAISPDAAAAREVASVAAGARLVQLGAFDSEAIARDVWTGLVGQHHDLLSEKSLYIERTTANARVFYRLRVAGFESTEDTRAMCEALRGRSVDCIPVTLQ